VHRGTYRGSGGGAGYRNSGQGGCGKQSKKQGDTRGDLQRGLPSLWCLSIDCRLQMECVDRFDAGRACASCRAVRMRRDVTATLIAGSDVQAVLCRLRCAGRMPARQPAGTPAVRYGCSGNTWRPPT
jgi:hypothetical protein